MVSEAVASAKSVVTLHPHQAKPVGDHAKILEKFESGGKIRRVSLEEMPKSCEKKSENAANYFYMLQQKLKGLCRA
jgi:dihydroxyacetone kinase-like predicted kinase